MLVKSTILIKWGLYVNYHRSWRGLENALEEVYGNYEERYAQILELYTPILDKNTYIVAKCVTNDATEIFEGLCTSFKVCVDGWFA